MRPTWHGQTEQLVLLRLVNMPSAMILHSEQFNLSWNVMGGLFSSFNLAQLSCTAGLQFLLLRISLYQQMTTFSHTGPKWLKHLIHRNSIHCMSARCWQKELTQRLRRQTRLGSRSKVVWISFLFPFLFRCLWFFHVLSLSLGPCTAVWGAR